jgi:hypothetical protein
MHKIYHGYLKSLFQVDFMKIIRSAAELCYVKDNLEIRLNEAKERYPDTDYSHQQSIVDKLKKNINVIYEVERDNNFLVKEIMKINNICSALQFDNFNHRLEIESLKKQLDFYKKQEVQIEEIMRVEADKPPINT